MSKGKRIVLSLLTGILAGLAATVALLVIFSVLCMLSEVTDGAGVDAVVLLCTASGAFAAGYSGARVSGSMGLLTGALCGAMCFILLLCASAAGGGEAGAGCLLRLALAVPSGAAGGVVGVNRRKRRKRSRKKKFR